MCIHTFIHPYTYTYILDEIRDSIGSSYTSHFCHFCLEYCVTPADVMSTRLYGQFLAWLVQNGINILVTNFPACKVKCPFVWSIFTQKLLKLITNMYSNGMRCSFVSEEDGATWWVVLG